MRNAHVKQDFYLDSKSKVAAPNPGSQLVKKKSSPINETNQKQQKS